eukprot:TRINITY_DN63326_c0_g3_i1.p1 TRINITY_DN63326_c0_g3~~TRINITY_DN63326_c0_g3_i1.p1  ORF type:complete len:389 (-),score=98.94 TRINITY_DN63326_c0_g3_i1:269-1309(-)
MKRELVFNAFCGLLMVAAWMTWTFTSRSDVADVIQAVIFWSLFCSVGINSITYPLWQDEIAHRARRRRGRGGSNDSSIRDDESLPSLPSHHHQTTARKFLKEYLQDDRRFKAFSKHMEWEFSLENLAFCAEVWQYQKLVHMYETQPFTASDSLKKQLIYQAFHIYQEFVLEKAPQCINISHDGRFKILELEPELKQLMKIFVEPENSSASKTDLVHHKPEKTPATRANRKKEENQAVLIVHDLDNTAYLGVRSSGQVPSISPRTSFSLTGTLPTEALAISRDILHMFDDVEQQILAMMELDSFSRFKRSAMYQKTETVILSEDTMKNQEGLMKTLVLQVSNIVSQQ